MRRFLSGTLLAALFALPVAARADTLDIVALIDSTPKAYWKTMQDGLKDASGFYGLETLVYSAKDADNQLRQCNFALLKGPRALVIAPINLEKLAPCLKRASEKKILLVDISGRVEEARAKLLGVRIDFSVAANHYDLGKMAAAHFKGRKGKMIILEGASVNLLQAARLRGFKENLPAGIQVVASERADDNRFQAGTVLDRVMVDHPDTSFVFAVSDVMALGAADALGFNYNKRVKVVGIDGTTEAVQAVNKGTLEADVAELPFLIAKQAIEKIQHRLADGTTYAFRQYTEGLILTRAALDARTDPLLQYLK